MCVVSRDLPLPWDTLFFLLYRSKISVTILIQILEKYEILFQRIARARGAPRGGEFV
jgi:hypothetical protein